MATEVLAREVPDLMGGPSTPAAEGAEYAAAKGTEYTTRMANGNANINVMTKVYRTQREEEALVQLLGEGPAQRMHRERVQRHNATVKARIDNDLEQIFTTAPKFGRSGRLMSKAFTARKWDDQFVDNNAKGPRGSKGWFSTTSNGVHKPFSETLGRDPQTARSQRALGMRRAQERVQRGQQQEKDKRTKYDDKWSTLGLKISKRQK